MSLEPFYLLLLVLGSLGTHSAFSQVERSGPSLQISFANGKSDHRIGEPVKLILSFTATEPGYVVETYYSPRFDDLIVSPNDGVYEWLYRLNRHYSHDDVSAPQQLSTAPVNVEITINDKVRFDKPGKYKVKFISRRVWRQKDKISFRQDPIPLASNEIELDVREMSPAEEQAEVKRITALMDSAKTLPQHGIVKRELDYLTGDVSTVEKVNRFLKPPIFGGVTWLDTGTGLNIARNKKLALDLLEAAFRDVDREPKEDLINRMMTLRILLEDEQRPSQAADLQQLGNERRARVEELRRQYDAEMLASLSKRTGRNQLGAALRIFMALPREDVSSEAYYVTKAIILERFDELKHHEQSDLLDRRWEKIKNRGLVPSLEKILSEKEPEPVWSNRANAFKRLIELDQKRARPFVIKEIRDRDSLINPDILTTLEDEYLVEVDDALLDQIKSFLSESDPRTKLRLQFKLSLASRYATDKIYADLEDIYKKYGLDQPLEQSGPLLAYLLKHNETAATPLVEERLAKWQEKSGSHVFFHLTRITFPKGLEKILRKRLESEDPETLGTASYYLSKYGGKENRKLIEKRHDRWVKEWAGRSAEFDDPEADEAIKAQAMAQINLLTSLMRTESWKLSDTETYHLRLKCASKACRENFKR